MDDLKERYESVKRIQKKDIEDKCKVMNVYYFGCIGLCIFAIVLILIK